MNLASLTEPQLVFPDLPGDDVSSVLRALARRVAELGYVSDSDRLHAQLMEREQLGSTGIGSGVAIPHCKMKGLTRAVLAVAHTQRPVEFGAVDGKPVRLLFLVISPAESPAVHLQVLSSISRWVKADHHVERLLATRDRAVVYELLKREGS